MFTKKFTKQKISKVYGKGFADWLFSTEDEKVYKLKNMAVWKLEEEVSNDEEYGSQSKISGGGILNDEEYRLIYSHSKYSCYKKVKIINLSKDQVIKFYHPSVSLYEKHFSLNPGEHYIIESLQGFRVKKDLIPHLQFEVGDLYWKYGDKYPTSRVCPLKKLN